jgi:Ca2+-binding EF-hand superfamily protein
MFRAAIVGFGPAGLGPLVAAARAGALNKWLRDGVVIFERGSRPGFGKFGQYLNTANTTAAYTLDPFRKKQSWTPCIRDNFRLDAEDPIMDQIRALPTFQQLDELSRQGPLIKGTLRQYGEFCEEVAHLFLQRVERSGTSRWYPDTTVDSLQLHGGLGSPVLISALAADGTHISVHCKSVLLATGGRPKLPTFNALLSEKLRSSDYIQRGPGMAEVKRLVTGKGSVKIAVIGSRHSAFSVSKLLLEMLEGADVSIEMLVRDHIRVNYSTVSRAQLKGYEVEPDAVCPVSGQVNRYSGIRPPVRDLYEAVMSGAESRLRFLKCGVGLPSEPKFWDALDRADLIVSAFGYASNMPILLDASGGTMEWALDTDGQALMNNSTCQLSVRESKVEKDVVSSLGEHPPLTLPNIFGSGLGFGLKAGGELQIGEPGVRIDGQAQYHSWVGVMGLNGLAWSTLQDGPWRAPEDALLCAILTQAWMMRTNLWAGPNSSQAGGSPSHGYCWDSHSPFASPLGSPTRSRVIAKPSSSEALLPASCDAVFADWDMNDDGELSVRELTEKLQDLGMPSSIEQLHALVRVLDVDNKGHVVADDLARYFARIDEQRKEEAITAIFASIDANGDGRISVSELQAHVARLGRTFLTPQEAMLMLQTLGRDDCYVGRAEFATLQFQAVHGKSRL